MKLTIEPLLFELSKPGRSGVELPACDVPVLSISDLLPSEGLRSTLPLPELSEPEVIRHYTHLSQLNYSTDSGFYPLGSCTMKYNPKLNEEVPRLPGFARVHPDLPDTATQGTLEVLYSMQEILAEIGGMDTVSLQPAAGAHGELLGLMLIKAYHDDLGQGQRSLVLVPEAAHGTNPASAARCGYATLTVRSDGRGRVDMAHLRTLLTENHEQVAALMLTNPNTLGLFEDDIAEICVMIHTAGGLVYCDGANMNALVGRARPGDMGFDVMHFNLHKTFSSPHGGGGPGSGPVGIKSILEPYLPVPQIIKTDGGYRRDYDRPKSIGRIHGYYGSFLCILRAYAYILYYGRERLANIAENAVLNANYIRVQLQNFFDVAYNELCMHECVFTAKRQQREHGIRALDIAKRLMDFGYHPPTIYFPLLVSEALMVEPTETESVETLDSFIGAMRQIAIEIETDPAIILSAPHETVVHKLDEATAARKPVLRWREQHK